MVYFQVKSKSNLRWFYNNFAHINYSYIFWSRIIKCNSSIICPCTVCQTTRFSVITQSSVLFISVCWFIQHKLKLQEHEHINNTLTTRHILLKKLKINKADACQHEILCLDIPATLLHSWKWLPLEDHSKMPRPTYNTVNSLTEIRFLHQ